MNYPKISIVTVVFNDVKLIENTIISIVNQTYSNFEYIIIDGGSTDGTLDQIRNYDSVINYWVSEKDDGIYDAMNKGIDIASGEWIIFMNSGDKFHNDDVLCDINFISLNENIFAIVGSALVFSEWGIFESKSRAADSIWKNFVHQSIFVKTNLAKEFKFNRSYIAASDFDFVYRLFLKKYEILSIDLIVSDIIFIETGFSSKNELRSLSEVLISIYKNRIEKYQFLRHFSYHLKALIRKYISIQIRLISPNTIKMIRKFRDVKRNE